MKIFITPWIDLSDEEIRKCIFAGAHSARIHTGKLAADRINSLIGLYDREHFKFYLDLRGNKASINMIDASLPEQLLNLGERVVVSAYPIKKHSNFQHSLGFNFLPQAVLQPVTGNLAFDDGRVLLSIDKLIQGSTQDDVYLECTVIKAGKVFPGDGVSSTDIFIHSGSDEPFSRQDIEIMQKIPRGQRLKVKYVAVSFVESAQHITTAIKVLNGQVFKNFQVVPKVETIKGIDDLHEICRALVKEYGENAELQIGRGDLSLDCGRLHPSPDYQQLVDQAVTICTEMDVKVSVLALVMQSVRLRCKQDRSCENMEPDQEELQNILHLKELGVAEIGLTNDMYIDRPERMIAKLWEILCGKASKSPGSVRS